MTDTITPLQELSERLECEATEEAIGQALADLIILRDSFDGLAEALGCETSAASILGAVQELVELREMVDEEAHKLGHSAMPLDREAIQDVLGEAHDTQKMAAFGRVAQEVFGVDDLTVRMVYESADPVGLLSKGRPVRVVHAGRSDMLAKIVGRLAEHDAEASRFTAKKGEGNAAE